MTGSVTKATPIQFIDSKSRIRKRRGRKIALSSYYACLSRDLLLMASGADTHIYTKVRGRNDFKKPGARGHSPCAPGLKTQMICSNQLVDVLLWFSL